MTLTEFIIRLFAKLLLIAAVIVLVIGGSCVEADTVYGVRAIVIGGCMAVPELVIAAVEYIGTEKE